MTLATISIANAKRDKIADRAIALAIDDIHNGKNIYCEEGTRAGEGNHGGEYTKINRQYVCGWVERTV